MIQKIRIQNFKAFRDTGDIEIKPITILMGVNSSGKSSIMQALLVLRQTMESRDIEVPLHVVGDYIDLGSYVDCVFQHQIAEKAKSFLSFEFSIVPDIVGQSRFRRGLVSTKTPQETTKLLNYKNFTVKTTFGYNKRARTIYLREFLLTDANHRVALYVKANASGQLSDAKSDGVNLDFNSKKIAKLFAKNLFNRKFFYEYRQYAKLSPQLTFNDERQVVVFTASSYDATERELSKVFYLGPLRKKTSRFNPITGEIPQDVGFEGENALKVIYKDSKASKKQSKKLFETTKKWLNKLNISKELKIVPLPGNHFALNIVDLHNNATVNLSDVGFGVSQILPVIVEGFYAPTGSTILVEQPEIHLHPALQSELGDLLHEISKEGKTMIVETHSEHLLLRLQRRIAERRLDSNDVAVYFVKPGKDGSTVERIILNENGQFVNWPPGFFEEDIHEGVEHLKAISQRNQQQALDID